MNGWSLCPRQPGKTGADEAREWQGKLTGRPQAEATWPIRNQDVACYGMGKECQHLRLWLRGTMAFNYDPYISGDASLGFRREQAVLQERHLGFERIC